MKNIKKHIKEYPLLMKAFAYKKENKNNFFKETIVFKFFIYIVYHWSIIDVNQVFLKPIVSYSEKNWLQISFLLIFNHTPGGVVAWKFQRRIE